MRLRQKTKNIIGGVITVVFFIGLIVLYQLLIVNGEQFEIKTINLDNDKQYLSSLLESYNIANGKNIFSFNAKKTSSIIEEKLHHIRSVKIKKELPSTVYVDISHRVPIMRLSENLLYVTDDTGKVFMATKHNTTSDIFETIPILLDEEAVLLRPGDTLNSKAQLALDIITKFNTIIDPSFSITQIDTSNEIYIILRTNKNKNIFIAWEELTDEQLISKGIEIAVNAMIKGGNSPLSKIIVLVKESRAHFAQM